MAGASDRAARRPVTFDAWAEACADRTALRVCGGCRRGCDHASTALLGCASSGSSASTTGAGTSPSGRRWSRASTGRGCAWGQPRRSDRQLVARGRSPSRAARLVRRAGPRRAAAGRVLLAERTRPRWSGGADDFVSRLQAGVVLRASAFLGRRGARAGRLEEEREEGPGSSVWRVSVDTGNSASGDGSVPGSRLASAGVAGRARQVVPATPPPALASRG